ncbi:MAG: RES family NAD+ phosphorylase [Planctomycetota bacterium]
MYRSATPQYARGADLLSGTGSRTHGGRFNPPRAFAAIYASLDPETAMAETLAHFRYYGIPEHAAMPRVFAALDVGLRRVLDLGDARVLKKLALSTEALVRDDWRRAQDAGEASLGQALGAAVFELEKWEGLIVPSAARDSGRNVVIFPERLGSKSWVRVLSR